MIPMNKWASGSFAYADIEYGAGNSGDQLEVVGGALFLDKVTFSNSGASCDIELDDGAELTSEGDTSYVLCD